LSEYEIDMTGHATIFAPSNEPLEIALLVLPGASILEVASVLDPIRNANRHLAREGFRWRVVSPGGAPVPLTCGLELPSTGKLAAAAGADALIVIAGYGHAVATTPALLAGLSRVARRFRAIGAVDTGSWVLARAGLLDGHRATVHWEDLEDFALAHPRIEVVPDRFVISRHRFTAGGAAPAADLMLHLIATRCGPAVAGQVAGSFLYEAAVDGARPQRPGMLPAARDARLSSALRQMSAHLESPLPLAAIARTQGLSRRRLEQLFRAGLGHGPGAAYMDLRLQAARRMVVDTRHALQEIALRCGFADQSSFSRAFRRRFGGSPRALRGGGAPPTPSDRV
jgi:transcriptional regulator GlxA family with amidase domain